MPATKSGQSGSLLASAGLGLGLLNPWPATGAECRRKIELRGDPRHPALFTERLPATRAGLQPGEFALGLRLIDPLNPFLAESFGRRRYGPSGEGNWFGGRRLSQARPRPSFRPGDEICPQWVALDVADNSVERVVRLDRERLEPPLGYRPGYLNTYDY